MQVIAIRELRFRSSDGQRDETITVSIGAPEQDKVKGAWSVTYEIHGPDHVELRRQEIRGVDGVQALVLALNVAIPERLALMAHDKDGSITFLDTEDLGFSAAHPIANGNE
jgi:hypothetical protein